jgi:hypothetical protein
MDQQKKLPDSIDDFTTTDASLLFFKNVRSLYYETIDNKDESILTFILRDRYSGKDRIVIQPFINIHRYEDRASITLKMNRDIQADTDSWIVWNSASPGKQGRITLDWTEKDHTRPAIEIYTHLISGDQFTLHTGDGKIKILHLRKDRETFRIILVDFLRLIEAD